MCCLAFVFVVMVLMATVVSEEGKVKAITPFAHSLVFLLSLTLALYTIHLCMEINITCIRTIISHAVS